MQTILRLSPAVKETLPASVRLRQGFIGTQCSARQLSAACLERGGRPFRMGAELLHDTVDCRLRAAAQLALTHPTPGTLKDAFDATDAVLAAVRAIARRAKGLRDVTGQVRIMILVSAMKAGLGEIEVGLEGIRLLPSSAPDYPTED